MATTIVRDVPAGNVFQILDSLEKGGKGEYIKLDNNSKINVVNCRNFQPGYVDPSMPVEYFMSFTHMIMANVRKVIRGGIDWELLRNQKQWLVNMDHAACAGGNTDNDGEPAGLVSFLDAFMDAVVAYELFTEEEVFGKLESELSE